MHTTYRGLTEFFFLQRIWLNNTAEITSYECQYHDDAFVTRVDDCDRFRLSCKKHPTASARLKWSCLCCLAPTIEAPSQPAHYQTDFKVLLLLCKALNAQLPVSLDSSRTWQLFLLSSGLRHCHRLKVRWRDFCLLQLWISFRSIPVCCLTLCENIWSTVPSICEPLWVAFVRSSDSLIKLKLLDVQCDSIILLF